MNISSLGVERAHARAPVARTGPCAGPAAKTTSARQQPNLVDDFHRSVSSPSHSRSADTTTPKTDTPSLKAPEPSLDSKKTALSTTFDGCKVSACPQGTLFLEDADPVLDFPPSPFQSWLAEQARLGSAGEQEWRFSSATFQGLPQTDAFSESDQKAWRGSVPLEPGRFFQSLIGNSGLTVGQTEVGLETQGADLCSVDYTLGFDCPKSGEEVGQMSRQITFPKDSAPEVYHAYFRLAPELQSQGLGKSLLAQSVELYDQIGVESVSVDAGLSVGGYAWAKYGFKPDSPAEAKRLFDQVRDRLDEASVPNRTRRLVQNLLKDNKPEAIWALSDLAQPVEHRGETTSLGKALLMGTGWYGQLELQNPAARSRFDSYVSGK
jgi:GNAT superfamily N-acetyltransferase